MKKLLINLDKCNGCRECELACAAKQSGTLKLLKRGKDGKLSHPRINLTAKPIAGSLISVISVKNFDPRYLPHRQAGSLLATRSIIQNPEPRTQNPAPDIYFPLLCFHCEEAPCLDACISGAMRRDKKTGLVNVDRDQCVGCWSCIMVCPFGVIQRRLKSAPTSAQSPAPRTIPKEFASKCNGCPDLAVPPCVRFCEPGALVQLSTREFTKTLRRQAVKRRTPSATTK